MCTPTEYFRVREQLENAVWHLYWNSRVIPIPAEIAKSVGMGLEDVKRIIRQRNRDMVPVTEFGGRY